MSEKLQAYSNIRIIADEANHFLEMKLRALALTLTIAGMGYVLAAIVRTIVGTKLWIGQTASQSMIVVFALLISGFATALYGSLAKRHQK